SEVRRLINEYSRKTTAHPFNDYGNDVKIKVNDDCLIQKCSIRTQYENRSKDVLRRPYRGWTIPPMKYNSLDEVDPWSFGLREPADFINKNTVLEIEGSASVCRCEECNGHGHNTCYSCHGKGKDVCPTCHGDYNNLRCPSCGGSGKKNCSNCGGSGYNTCSHCNGAGSVTIQVSEYKYHWDYIQKRQVGGYEMVNKTTTCNYCHGYGEVKCQSCGGKGKFSCSRCSGFGKITCTNCNKGYIICKTCGGDGKLVCSVCEGEGRNEFRYVVKRFLNQETLTSFICDPRVREFAESYDLTLSGTDYKVRKKSLDDDLCPENVRCSSALSKLLRKADPDSGIILFQEATVEHAETTYIEYEFNGETFIGYICAGTFYADGSPIDKWSSELLEKAEKKINRGSSAGSIQMLETAKKAGADSFTVETLLNRARTKLGNMKDAGTGVAFWLVALFVSPFVFNFYQKLNPVAPWAIVTNNPNWAFAQMVPIIQTLLFLFFALILRIYLSTITTSKDYSSIWIYFARGFFGFLLSALGLLAGLFVVNYLGVSILTTFIFGIILYIILFCIGMVELIIHWISSCF
ncbi:MAG: hypothetical protein HUJ95_02355, partial [Bacteroidales bacterium]|nr:hypothetical protein [Bacteroidales bacterium]